MRIATLALLMLPMAAVPAPPDPGPIVGAERAFAADVATLGVRDGTLRHLMEESVVFRPLPVAARGWYAAQDTADFRLEWHPWFAELAASGDFGWSLGPWRSSPLQEGRRPDGHGFYLTVWIRDAQGDWKVLADHGVSTGAPAAERTEVEAMGATRSQASVGSFLLNTRYQGLMAAALRVPSAQLPGGAEVERAWLAEDLIVLRPGRPPLQGHEAVRQVLLGELGASAPDLTVMAASGDLGMSLGGDPEHGAYLRVWRHDDAAGWQLAVEAATPVVAPAPAAAPDPAATGVEAVAGPGADAPEETGGDGGR